MLILNCHTGVGSREKAKVVWATSNFVFFTWKCISNIPLNKVLTGVVFM